MGLGKTLQIITFLAKLKEEKLLKKKPCLVVVPTTLLTNWQNEIKKFCPSLKAYIYHGANRKFPEDSYDLLLTSYGMVRSEAALSKQRWQVVVLDEAQNIKNAATQQTKAVKKLKAENKIAMTGTPIENRLNEYWSILDFLNKGYLGGLKYFNKEFSLPIELERDQHQLNIFKKITAPLVLRRLKTDKKIISDLPDKIEMDQVCNLTKEQLALYQNVVDNTMQKIEKAEGMDRRGLIFSLMTSLKQICNHPAHFLKKKTADFVLSGKTKLLKELLTNINENNEKVLIFTQYTEMGFLLQDLISQELQQSALFLHGGLSRKKRDEMVEKFQNEKHTRIMLLSLKAGGTGLNLTKATNVIHFDLWWNPATENQATDRAYRIGQEQNVMVYRLITEGTFEEKINEMIMRKKELADLAINQGEKWIGEFNDEELQELVAVRG